MFMRKVKTAVFPVGGLGTRFLPATKSMPKEMLPIANKPIIQYAYEEAKAAGIEKFIFVTGRNKNSINNHFDHSYELESKLDDNNKKSELDQVMSWLPSPGQIAFVRQQKPLGLGHAIWCARNFIANDEAFIVILADEMMSQNKNRTPNFLGSMIDLYNTKEVNSSIVAVGEIEKEITSCCCGFGAVCRSFRMFIDRPDC
jgi:UTP-glucose-1-phosphate uridylyltransferase